MADIAQTGLAPALQAYRNAVERAGGGGETAGQPAFGALLQQVLSEAAASGRAGETAALEALAGGASLQEVVEAVTAAELGLEAVTAVRDRVISAYQEIMRMPI